MISDQQGDIKTMVQDLYDTLAYIKSSDFHQLAPDADQQKVVLFGHSAGAHLCALSAIDLAERVDGQTGAAKTDAANLPRLILEENAGKSLESEEVVRHPASLLSEEQIPSVPVQLPENTDEGSIKPEGWFCVIVWT